MTTLTKAAIFEKGKARYEEVEIEGVGTVGIQSISELKQCRRDHAAIDQNGQPKSEWRDRIRANAIVDQICNAPGKPAFTNEDIESILAMDHAITRRLFAAIQKFNGEDTKKKDGSDDSETN